MYEDATHGKSAGSRKRDDAVSMVSVDSAIDVLDVMQNGSIGDLSHNQSADTDERADSCRSPPVPILGGVNAAHFRVASSADSGLGGDSFKVGYIL